MDPRRKKKKIESIRLGQNPMKTRRGLTNDHISAAMYRLCLLDSVMHILM